MPRAATATATVPKKRYMKIKIEDHIPLPKYTKMPIRNDLEEDLKVMEPLQSRLIDMEFSEKNLNAMRTRINAIQKKAGLTDRRFTVNADPVTEEDENKTTLMRVWRVQ